MTDETFPTPPTVAQLVEHLLTLPQGAEVHVAPPEGYNEVPYPGTVAIVFDSNFDIRWVNVGPKA